MAPICPVPALLGIKLLAKPLVMAYKSAFNGMKGDYKSMQEASFLEVAASGVAKPSFDQAWEAVDWSNVSSPALEQSADWDDVMSPLLQGLQEAKAEADAEAARRGEGSRLRGSATSAAAAAAVSSTAFIRAALEQLGRPELFGHVAGSSLAAGTSEGADSAPSAVSLMLLAALATGLTSDTGPSAPMLPADGSVHALTVLADAHLNASAAAGTDPHGHGAVAAAVAMHPDELASALLVGLGMPDAMVEAEHIGTSGGMAGPSLLQVDARRHVAMHRLGHVSELGPQRPGGILGLRYPLGITGQLGLQDVTTAGTRLRDSDEADSDSVSASSLLQRGGAALASGESGVRAVQEALRRMEAVSSDRVTSQAALEGILGAPVGPPDGATQGGAALSGLVRDSARFAAASATLGHGQAVSDAAQDKAGAGAESTAASSGMLPLMERVNSGGRIVEATASLFSRLLRAGGLNVPDSPPAAATRKSFSPPMSDEPLAVRAMLARMAPPGKLSGLDWTGHQAPWAGATGGASHRFRHGSGAGRLMSEAARLAAEVEAEGRVLAGGDLPLEPSRLQRAVAASLGAARSAAAAGQDPLLAQVEAATDMAVSGMRIGGGGIATIAKVRESQAQRVREQGSGALDQIRRESAAEAGASEQLLAAAERAGLEAQAHGTTSSWANRVGGTSGPIGAAIDEMERRQGSGGAGAGFGSPPGASGGADAQGIGVDGNLLQLMSSAGWYPPLRVTPARPTAPSAAAGTGEGKRAAERAEQQRWAEGATRALQMQHAARDASGRPAEPPAKGHDVNHDPVTAALHEAHSLMTEHAVEEVQALLQLAAGVDENKPGRTGRRRSGKQRPAGGAKPSVAPTAAPSASPKPFDGKYPNLWSPVEEDAALEVSDCADGRLGRHCKHWIPPPDFDLDSSGFGNGFVAPQSVSDSAAAATARRMASNRVVAEGNGPRGGVAGPPGGEAPSGDPDWGDLYEIGDHVDCNKGGWKPGRVVGTHRFAPKTPAWGYDVILDKGGECKEAVVIQLRPMMEGKCLRFHFPIIPIPPVLNIPPGIANPAIAFVYGAMMAPFAMDPANQPFVVMSGFFMLPGSWLGQAGGDVCICPCGVDKHPYVALMDCVSLAQMEVSEGKLRDAMNTASEMVSTFTGMYHAYKAHTKEAQKISGGLPPVVIPGEVVVIPDV